eukprot:4796019-Pyramimonas_sp.AAC.1
MSRLIVLGADDRDCPMTAAHVAALFAADRAPYVVLAASSPGKTKIAIEREADEPAKEDLVKHRVEVGKARLKELGNRTELGALKQRGRRGCASQMDFRWVMRWKKQTHGKIAIEARQCIEGFKGMHQGRWGTFSAAASRQSQRIVNIIAAGRPRWMSWSGD